MKYIIENTPDNLFKILLQKMEKQKMKSTDLINLYTMFSQVCISKFHDFANNDKMDVAESFFTELINYFNDTSKNYAKKYSCVHPNIMVTNKGEYKLLSLPHNSTKTKKNE